MNFNNFLKRHATFVAMTLLLFVILCIFHIIPAYARQTTITPLITILSVQAEQSDLNYFVDGVEAFESADYDEAIRSFKKAIELNPSNLEFQYYLGLTYGALERKKEALEIFESITKKDPVNFFKAYFDIASLYSKEKEYQKAIDTLRLAEKIDPKSVRIYLETGYAYKNLKDYEQAIKNLNRAKELDPKLTQMVYYDIAAVYLEDEQFDRAEEIFNKAIEVDPKTAIAENARMAIPNIKATKRARKPWYLFTSFTWAYDDNVPLDPLDMVTPRTGEVKGKGDQFQTFFFRGGYKFVNRKDLEVGAGYSLLSIGYKEWPENNILAHIPHLYLQHNEDPIYFRIQYDFSYYYAGGRPNGQDKGLYLTFGDDSDDKMRMHSVVPTITIVEPYNLKSDIILNYQKKEYLDDLTPDASHYSGGIIQSYRLPNSERHVRAGYKYGYEDATDEESSYRYHEALLGFFSPICWGVMGDISLSHMRTFYQNFPIEGDRHDRNYIVAISLTRPFSPWLQLQFFYNYVHNNSNALIDENDPYKFEKNVYLLSATYVF